MKKVFLFAALAAGLGLTSCSSDEKLGDSPQAPSTQGSNSGAIGFDVYTQKANTRGGWVGSVTNTALKETADASKLGYHGFGVFGYYTDNNEYEQRSVPNFMYNQQVTWNGSTAFTYSPVVYWPNEYGDNAISDDSDKLTFFAYMPYTAVIPSSGKLADATGDNEQWGITGMTKNTTQGDPILKYIGSFNNKKSVDLCWGVCDQNDGLAWDLTKTGTSQSPGIANGMPWIDLERPAGVDQKVRFTFKHATAQLRVSIDAVVNDPGHDLTNPVTDKTRIWVREVKFKGFTMKGSLNLNNAEANKPLWLDFNGQNELVAEDVIVYDGRKEGKEGVAGAVATNEKVLGLNPTLIQDGVYEKGDGTDVYDVTKDVKVYGVDASGASKSAESDWERKGVTNKAVNLFCTTDDNKSDNNTFDATKAFFHVIPGSDPFEIEIVYDVETTDANLAQNLSDGATKGTSIENRITKTIKFGEGTNDNRLQAGHSYMLNLHLGMNSVKFDAAVTDWIDEAAQDVDLPLNTPVWAAATSTSANPGGSEANAYGITIPYTGHYDFAISGLNGGESVTAPTANQKNTTTTTDAAESETAGMFATWSVSTNNAWTNGVALQKLTTTTNPSTCDRIQKFSIKGSQSEYETFFKVTQKAHPLYLTAATNIGTEPKVITLTRHNTADRDANYDDWTHAYGWFCAEDGKALTGNGDPELAIPTNGIAVYRNGSKLEWQSGTPPTGNKFTFANQGVDAHTAKITVGDDLKAGDVIKVVLKTGDAPVETVTCTVQ